MHKVNYKYRIDAANKVIVAFSTFAKRKIAGVAKCAPGDDFDVERGKELATARCNFKVAKLRRKRAAECLAQATEIAAFWAKRESDMLKYLNDASNDFESAKAHLEKLESIL